MEKVKKVVMELTILDGHGLDIVRALSKSMSEGHLIEWEILDGTDWLE